MFLLARVPAVGDVCGDRDGAVCEAVWDATGNRHLARLADWFIGRPLTVVGIIVVAWILAKLARRAIRRLVYRLVVADPLRAGRALERVGVAPGRLTISDPRREGRARSISTVLASTAAVVIWVVALILVIGELGVNLAPLIASAGIAGIALGFGAQSLVKDCITGTFMLIEDQYGIGDIVDLGEARGSVERISLRTTVVRGQDGTVWHVPNGEIRRVGNQSQQWSVAVLDITVGPAADLGVTSEVIESTARRVTTSDDHAGEVLGEPELLGVESVRPDGVTLRLLVKTKPGTQFRLQRALREEIQLELGRAGVPAPPVFPTTRPEPPPVP